MAESGEVKIASPDESGRTNLADENANCSSCIWKNPQLF